MNKSIYEIQNLIATNQLDQALQNCQREVKKQPHDLVFNKLLSYIWGLKENYTKAIETIKNILPQHPHDFDLINNLGSYYIKAEEFLLAQEYIDQAKSINPDSPSPYHNAAEVNIVLRKFDFAKKEIEHALYLYEKNNVDFKSYIPTLLLRINIYIADKDQEGAIKFILKYLKIEFHSELFLQLVQIDKNSVSADMIVQCEKLLQQKMFKSSISKFQHLVPLYFALALYHEKNDKKKSEEYYVKANQEIFSIQRLNIFEYQKEQNKIMDTFKLIENLDIEDQHLGKFNYFIVGLPRSGTTLMESLITANREVFPGGELNIFNKFIPRLIADGHENLLTKLQSMGEEYVRMTNDMKNDFKSTVDKMPMNFSYVGYIQKCLPASKIIILVRQPWDVAISLFKQRYVTNIAYSSSFFNIGVYIANFEAMVMYWGQFPSFQSNILRVQYEDLVHDLDTQRENLYRFLEIEGRYDPAIREKFFARTASMNQVQKAVHQTSVKKSDFSEHFGEFDDAYRSQKEYWERKGIDFYDKFLGIY